MILHQKPDSKLKTQDWEKSPSLFLIFSLVTEKKLSLSATRNRDILLLLYYNTLSATRKVLRKRYSIVEKTGPQERCTS